MLQRHLRSSFKVPHDNFFLNKNIPSGVLIMIMNFLNQNPKM